MMSFRPNGKADSPNFSAYDITGHAMEQPVDVDGRQCKLRHFAQYDW